MKSSDLKQKLAIVYALAAVSVVVLVVVAIVIVNGTQEDEPSSAAATEQASPAANSGNGDDDSPPPLRTVAVQRGEGANAAVSAASPSMKRPEQIWLRVSAAPKQEVSGSWNVSCGSGNVTDDTFTVTPPQLISLELPDDNASCIAGSAAQIKGEGRLKLTILRER